MKALKTFIILVLIAVIAGAAYWAYQKYTSAPEASHVTMEKAKITDLAPMLRLCSVEIYDDVPVKGNLGSKHIFAKTTLNGSISFDLENIQMTESGDTLNIILPKEIVDVYESTDPGSYRVIDTWNDSYFGSSNFSNSEENSIKAKARENYVKEIYKKGYVERARMEAVDNLTTLLTGLTGKTVIVNDPTPKGSL